MPMVAAAPAIASDAAVDFVLHTGDYIYEYGREGYGGETGDKLENFRGAIVAGLLRVEDKVKEFVAENPYILDHYRQSLQRYLNPSEQLKHMQASASMKVSPASSTPPERKVPVTSTSGLPDNAAEVVVLREADLSWIFGAATVAVSGDNVSRYEPRLDPVAVPASPEPSP